MFSEQDVDRELEAALSVSPSPDFEARVLQRVEADRPSSWTARHGWLAAAASIVIVAGVLYALNRTSPVVSEPTVPHVAAQPAPRVVMPQRETPTQKIASEPPRAEPVRASRTATRSAPRTSEPEVIVSLTQMEAVRRLVREVNAGRLEPPAAPFQGPMTPPAKLRVTPVIVEPIPLSPLVPATETATPFIRSSK